MRPIGLAVAAVLAAAAVAVPIGLTAGQPADDRDCSSFATQQEAQAYFDAKGYSADNDPERLDNAFGRGDGVACEELPNRPAAGAVDTDEELTIETEPPFNPEIHNAK